VLEAMPRSYQQFIYLRWLLEPTFLERDEDGRGPLKRRLDHIDIAARRLYIELLCEYDTSGIIRAIRSLPEGFLDLQEAKHSALGRYVCMVPGGSSRLAMNEAYTISKSGL